MAADYDLVVLGGTIEGRVAATAAADYGARVALIEPPGLFEENQRSQQLLQGIQQLGEGLQQEAVNSVFCRSRSVVGPGRFEPVAVDWPAVLEWSAISSQSQLAPFSTAAMAASGIDVVFAMPTRLSRQCVVVTEQRAFKARGILAAFGVMPVDLSALWTATSLPQQVRIEGGSPQAVVWAEALCALGVRVQLVAERFLPNEDEDIRRLMKAELMIAGVDVVLNDTFYQSIQDSCVLSFNNLQPALRLPNFVYSRSLRGLSLRELSLRELSLKGLSPALIVNSRLQTAHSRIFACGAVLKGDKDGSCARKEARLAAWNALFMPTRVVNYGAWPVGYRGFARVGLTQSQAEETYGQATQVWVAHSAQSETLARLSPNIVYCKLVCVNNKLRGTHLLGEGASELIQQMSLEIGRPVEALINCITEAQGLGGVVREAVERAQQSRWQVGCWRRDWAENWFNWRRSR